MLNFPFSDSNTPFLFELFGLKIYLAGVFPLIIASLFPLAPA